jgi:hypothetical protein
VSAPFRHDFPAADPAAVDVDELIKFWILAEQLIGKARRCSAGFRAAAQALQPARPGHAGGQICVMA